MMRMFNFKLNKDRDPKITSCNTMIELYWDCNKGHTFKSRGCDLKSRGYKCKECYPSRNVSPKVNSLQAIYPDISAHYDRERNGNTPDQVHKGSKRLVWWLCDFGHNYDREVYVEVRYEGRCPICTGYRLVPGINDLETLYPHLAPMWSPNNPKPMNMYSPKSDFKAELICSSGHVFLRRIFHQTNGNLLPCPECPKPIPFETSVASSDLLMSMWSEVNEEDPRYIKKKSHKIFTWNGRNCGHAFMKSVKDVTETYGKCSDCKNTQEDIFADFIKDRYELSNILRNKRLLKSDEMNLELDIVVPDKNIAIEFNGELWHSNIKISSNSVFGSAVKYHSWKISKSKDINLDLKFVWAHDWRAHKEELFDALDELFMNGESDSPFLNRLESRFDRDLDCGCEKFEKSPEWLTT